MRTDNIKYIKPEDMPRGVVMKVLFGPPTQQYFVPTGYAITGALNGQSLWHKLTREEKQMASAWCHPTGYGQNTARRQQLSQMLSVFLKRAFPNPTGTDTRVSVAGFVSHLDGVIRFWVHEKYGSAKRDCTQLASLFFGNKVTTTLVDRQELREAREKHAAEYEELFAKGETVMAKSRKEIDKIFKRMFREKVGLFACDLEQEEMAPDEKEMRIQAYKKELAKTLKDEYRVYCVDQMKKALTEEEED